jgi:hypothetical protein
MNQIMFSGFMRFAPLQVGRYIFVPFLEATYVPLEWPTWGFGGFGAFAAEDTAVCADASRFWVFQLVSEMAP